MRRSGLLLSSVFVLSAAFALPMWHLQDAKAADPASPGIAAAPAKSAAAPDAIKAQLNSVPEDGNPYDDIPASSRLVRDLIAAHPHEDLVICIAGCIPGFDRVIYAQPADPLAKKPAVANVTPEAVPTPVVPAAAPVAAPAPAEEAKSPPAPAAEAQAAKAAAPSQADMKKSEPDTEPPKAADPVEETPKATEAPADSDEKDSPKMEPTAAEPEQPSSDEDAAPAPPADDVSPADKSSE